MGRAEGLDVEDALEHEHEHEQEQEQRRLSSADPRTLVRVVCELGGTVPQAPAGLDLP